MISTYGVPLSCCDGFVFCILIYLSQALRLLDPSGVVLEKVCSPVREYLHNRNDTVRCIVASLTNDCESELAEVCMYN